MNENDEPCPTCGGSGWITEEVLGTHYDKDGKRTSVSYPIQRPCTTCGGRGTIKD